ncbi:MAG: aspartyl protease family protein [Pyrinomonadaceae bacterium]
MRRIVLMMLLAVSVSTVAQAQPGRARPNQSHVAAAVQSVHRIPFEFYANHIYVEVRVNGSQSSWFILDSGAPDTYITEEQAKALGLKLGGSLGVTGTGQERLKASYVKGARYSLSGIELSDGQSVAVPRSFFLPLESSFGKSFSGIIGYELFDRFVVEVDYAARTINLYEPKNYRYSGSGEIIPLILNGNKPYVNAMLTPLSGASIASRLHVDLGSSGTLGLNWNFVESNNLVGSAREMIESFNLGVGGETKTLVGRVKSLRLGRLTIESPITSFSLAHGRGVRSDSAGRIGNRILRRFKVILDYSRKQMILEQGADSAQTYEYDMSGMFLLAEGQDFKLFRVHKLVPNSPAAEAGLRAGDIITNVDNQPAADLTLERVRQIFTQEGQTPLVSIKRGQETLHLRLRLRRLI